MNEQIKQLAIEAGYKIDNSGNIYTEDYDGVCNKELNKFANLIVLECMNATRGSITGLDAFNNIKNHFGIEQ